MEPPTQNTNSAKFLYTGFSEVDTILIDSLRVFSEKAAIVCLFGARRLSQHNLILSLPSPRKGASTRMYEGSARRVWTILAYCAERRQQGSLFTGVGGRGILRSSHSPAPMPYALLCPGPCSGRIICPTIGALFTWSTEPYQAGPKQTFTAP